MRRRWSRRGRTRCVMQHRMVDQAELQTDVPLSSVGSDDEQISGGHSVQERLACRALDDLAAHRHVRIPQFRAAQGVGKHLGRRAIEGLESVAGQSRRPRGLDRGSPGVLRQDPAARTWASRNAKSTAVPLPSPSSAPTTMHPNRPCRCSTPPRTTTTGPSARVATATSFAERRVLGQRLPRQPYPRSTLARSLRGCGSGRTRHGPLRPRAGDGAAPRAGLSRPQPRPPPRGSPRTRRCRTPGEPALLPPPHAGSHVRPFASVPAPHAPRGDLGYLSREKRRGRRAGTDAHAPRRLRPTDSPHGEDSPRPQQSGQG
ncbi:hypothetical protein RKD27_008550 [Streptomyces sp. SAI-126]